MEKHDQFKSENNLKTIEIEEPNEILFPKMCLICGQTTESKFNKKLQGSSISDKSYRNMYHFSLPICISCQRKMNLKTGITTKYGISILFSILSGLIAATLIIYFISSYVMGFAILGLLIAISTIYYLKKTKDKIKLDEYLKIIVRSDEKDTIELAFKNNEYSQFIERIN